MKTKEQQTYVARGLLRLLSSDPHVANVILSMISDFTFENQINLLKGIAYYGREDLVSQYLDRCTAHQRSVYYNS